MQYSIDSYESLKTAVADFCAYLIQNGVSNDSIFDCRLVVSELVGNILKHEQTTAFLSVQVTDTEVVLSVRSANGFEPPVVSRCSGVYAENGRGLFLVYTLCDGQMYTEENTIVVKIRIEK